MYTYSVSFTTPLSIGKDYIGDILCIAVLKYNSRLEYKSADFDVELGNNLTLKAYGEWCYMEGSIDEKLMPIIEAYQEEGAEVIQHEIEERERYNEAIAETEKSLQGF